MLTPSYLAGVAEPMVKLWSQLERDIMADLAKRIVKMGGVSETSDWQIRKLREMGIDGRQIAKQLKKLTNTSDRELKAAIRGGLAVTLWHLMMRYIRRPVCRLFH